MLKLKLKTFSMKENYPTFQSTKPHCKTEDQKCGSLWCLWREFKKCWIYMLKSSIHPCVCTNASCQLLPSICPQQWEGSIAVGRAVQFLLTVIMWCDFKRKHLVVSYRHAWWVRVSITTQYNNIYAGVWHQILGPIHKPSLWAPILTWSIA